MSKAVGRLEGRVALVTGAARGIGAAVAAMFHAEGARVFATDLDAAVAAVAASGAGTPVEAWVHDVREEAQWRQTIDRVLARSGRLDVLVNNAGIIGDFSRPQDPEGVSLEDWRAVHRTNLDGVFLGCKHAMLAMKGTTRAGSIINMSSRSGVVGIPGAAAYASSKAGVRNHTKSVALWCAQQGYPIRCNSVHAGAILTPMWDTMFGTEPGARERGAAEIGRTVPLGRMGEPADVAHLAVYLASDESKYVTGAEFTLDGGILAGSAASPGARDEGH